MPSHLFVAAMPSTNHTLREKARNAVVAQVWDRQRKLAASCQRRLQRAGHRALVQHAEEMEMASRQIPDAEVVQFLSRKGRGAQNQISQTVSPTCAVKPRTVQDTATGRTSKPAITDMECHTRSPTERLVACKTASARDPGVRDWLATTMSTSRPPKADQKKHNALTPRMSAPPRRTVQEAFKRAVKIGCNT